jgi:hypothetical protein
VVLRIVQSRSGVEVDAWDVRAQTPVRWQARQAIVALPVFVAARVVQNAPEFLRQAAQRTVYAPWLVANIHLKAPLQDRAGAAPSWDNVIYGAAGLGYVDASHQNLQMVPGATVLTHYRALGAPPHLLSRQREQLLSRSWSSWRDEILAELSVAHPDLREQATRMDITRYGHAMAIPIPQSKHKQLLKTDHFLLTDGRLRFAHADWAGYSVFEEAFTLGHTSGSSL